MVHVHKEVTVSKELSSEQENSVMESNVLRAPFACGYEGLPNL